ncbi:MAG: CHAT domain-containing protein, partial [Elsteraceae bacterium]
MKLVALILALALAGCAGAGARGPVTRSGAVDAATGARSPVTAVDFARTYDATGNFAAGEEAWRSIIAEKEDAESLIRLAIDVANLGRTREGQIIVERAARLNETKVGQRLPVLIALARAQLAVLEASGSDTTADWNKATDLLAQSHRAVQSEMRRRNMDPVNPSGDSNSVEADISPTTLRITDLELHYLNGLAALRKNEVDAARKWLSDGVVRLDRLGAAARPARHAAMGTLLAELLARSGSAAEREMSVAQAERAGNIARTAAGPNGGAASAALMATGRAIVSAADFEKDKEIAAARRRKAMDYFREGLRRLDAQDERPKTISNNLAVAVLDTMGALLPAVSAADRPAFYKEMLSVAQRVPVGAAARASELAASRRLVEDPEAGALIRDWQDNLRKRDEIQTRILELYAQGAPDESKLQPLRQERIIHDTEAKARREELGKRFPDILALLNPKSPSVEDLQAALQPNEAVILMLSGRRGGWTFGVQKDQIEAQEVVLERQEIVEQVKLLRQAFEPVGGKLRGFDLAVSNELYEELLGRLTNTMAPGRRLIFITSGALSALPPALFVTKPERGSDYARASWLIKDHAVLTVPSAGSLISSRKLKSTAAARMLLAVGDPVLSGPKGAGTGAVADACEPDGGVPREMIDALEPLPDTADEVRAVSGALGGGDILLGREATAASFQSRDLSSYRILYFATHGILPGELKCRTKPGLIFTPSPSHAGLLDTSEISQLKLNADLVVMSACNTAGASELGGESLSGLAESFIFAGARSLIASHWQVPSRETAL